MVAANFNLRGIEPKIMAKLKLEAKRGNTSVNVIILELIKRGIGYSNQVTRPVYHELDDLAGTWTKQEADEFTSNTQYFEKIDEDLWS